MSTTLWWKPLRQPGFGISHPLKGILARHYWKQDGSLGSDSIVFDEKDIPFLQTVIKELQENATNTQKHQIITDSYKQAITECEQLIAAIKEYWELELWLE